MKSFKAKNVHQEFQGAGQAPRDHDERGVMPAFSDLKTGTKITATFLVVAVLLIAVAAVGYVSLKSVNAGMTTLYEDRLLPTQQLGRVNDAQLKIKRDLYQYILVSEDRNNLERDIADNIQSADKSIQQYEATYLVPDEERGLAEFRPAWAAYLRAVEDFLRQAKAGNTQAALQSVSKGGAVFASRQVVDQILAQLIEVQARVGISLKQAGDRTFARASAIMAAAGLFGVLMAIVLGVVMGRSITRPLARITNVATQIAGGNLDTSSLAEITSRDEIGVLARTLDQMAGQLKLMLEGLRKTHDELEMRVQERTSELKRSNDQLELEVGERKRAEAVLTLRSQELARSNAELDAFAYMVSHDLRAPLRHIDGFLELLQTSTGKMLNAQSRHYMDTISEAAQKMGLLIDNLLSFSRMGRHAMSFQQVALEPLVREVIHELEPDAAGRTIEWRVGDLPEVRGDAAMLRMVLDNLIANALKFTRPRQQARIEIGALPGQGAGATIFVRDNGVGFDMAYRDKLFGVFQRLHRAEEFEGTGIGLANVRRIITRHGGRTWAEGKPDQGAAFFFSLPQYSKGVVSDDFR